MTREEQIERQGTIYSDIPSNYIEWGDGWQDYDDRVYIERAFIKGAKWADETMIDKVCEWLKAELYQHKDRDGYPNVESRSYTSVRDLIDNFKKAMES